jgi:hypothetical protein
MCVAQVFYSHQHCGVLHIVVTLETCVTLRGIRKLDYEVPLAFRA